jgi:hypothetical protein
MLFWLVGHVPAHDAHELASSMEHAERMDEARVRRSRIDEIAEPELANAAKPLERRCLDHPPQHPLERVALVEFNQVMKRIADPLALPFGH